MDGYFTDDSMLRRVNREWALALSGPRALLMQAAHPLAVTGLLAHTDSIDDPYGRLERTAEIMNVIGFGSKAEADRVTGIVRTQHARVRGRLPAAVGAYPKGTPYAADDPELLLWVLATLADSALVVYRRYVGSLSAAERDAYWQDYRRVGRLFGLRLRDMPRDIDGFDAYMEDMLASGDLHVSDRARELGKQIVLHPPLPLTARPLVELVNFITVGLLPPDLRRQYRLSWDPLRGLALAGGAEYVKRVLVPLLPGRVRWVPSARAT